MANQHKYIKDYPRPQVVREAWTNLNGIWDFKFDDYFEGEKSGWYKSLPADKKINVPFTYETKASGIGEECFHPCIWYQRPLEIPNDVQDKSIKIHFQASDYITKVWVNGICVGTHEGGYSAFTFDITDAIEWDQDNVLTVKVEDTNSCTQPRGKQRWTANNYECWYVQTTGIWQTVWLEYVNPAHINSLKMTPDIDSESVTFEYGIDGVKDYSKKSIETVVSFNGQHIRTTETTLESDYLSVNLNLVNIDVAGQWRLKLWHPNHPNLYDVTIHLKQDGQIVDTVFSYFGMRKISIEGDQILLNNVAIYQRLLLDQGYWEDTHLTPPSEEALIEDIDKTLELGFNGVRKHQKLEDPRYLYWCDRKGLLVWSEMAATYQFNDAAVEQFTNEWMSVVRQHYNHPSIITWTPFNESWGVSSIFSNRKQQQFTESIYHLTKSIDPMRPVIVNDGWEHTISDIITLHDYEEIGEHLLERYKDKEHLLSNEFSHNAYKYPFAKGYEYKGQPVIISEYGGIAFTSKSGWGYGNQVRDEKQFIERYDKITQALKDLDYVVGFCYTQITDVQQEVNGLLTINREYKVDPNQIREINLR